MHLVFRLSAPGSATLLGTVGPKRLVYGVWVYSIILLYKDAGSIFQGFYEIRRRFLLHACSRRTNPATAVIVARIVGSTHDGGEISC